MKNIIDAIAHAHMNIATLQPSGSDREDFHELGVQTLRKALDAAYYAGYCAHARAARGEQECALPTEVHTLRAQQWLHAGPATPEDGPDAESVTTGPIPEIALLGNRWREHEALTVLIPLAMAQRRLPPANVHLVTRPGAAAITAASSAHGAQSSHANGIPSASRQRPGSTRRA